MDIKKLTRGDLIVAGAALLILIFSFLTFFKAKGGGDYTINAWGTGIAPVLSATVLTPIVAAVLFVVGGLLPTQTQLLGLTLRQWAVPLAVVTPINALWSLGGGGVGDTPDALEVGIGAIFIVLASIVLAGGIVATELVPALKAPLGIGGAPRQQGAPYGGQPAYGGAAPQPGPYGGDQPAYGGGAPQAAPAPAPAAADPSFQPYWFSVPDQRQLVDAQTNAPAGSLNPGVWYLAVAQHGQGLLVEVDGVRGVLWNVSGIQKS